jgi:DNA-binding NarL/FixJ family response regulator
MKILLIDDHALFRAGMKYMLQELSDDVNIVEAYNCESAVKSLQENMRFDLILLDLDMPGISGFAGINHVTLHAKECPIVILSADNRDETIRQAAQYGVKAYIQKSTEADQMLPILHRVLEGESALPEHIFDQTKDDVSVQSKLTARQMEILSLIVQGKSNKQIAYSLGITEGTTRIHVTTIFKVLNVRSRSEAVYKALNLNLDYKTATL